MIELIENFLTDLENANRSPLTVKNYQADLFAFAHAQGEDGSGIITLSGITVGTLRDYFASQSSKSAATRARHQSSLAAFFKWAVRHGHATTNPMDLLDRVKLPAPVPRGVSQDKIKRILDAIPTDRTRDRLMFKLIAATGLRASEVLALYVEDIDLVKDDEHFSVVGKGQKRRTIFLDDTALVVMLKKYLQTTGYQYGHLFRAEKNAKDASLGYDALERLWSKYCERAEVEGVTLHQLRHSHATELVNAGASLSTIRKRLGHAHMQTTLRYAEQTDRAADDELRAIRRRQNIERGGRG